MIVGISTVRDEADIVGYTIEHLLAHGVDHLLIADNLSKDDTRLILDKYPEVTVVDNPDEGHHQHDTLTYLSAWACELGADWILPFDGDELFYPRSGTLAGFFERCEYHIVCATIWDHIVTDADGYDLNPYRRITHRRPHPQKLPKVAYRADPKAELHPGNHDVFRDNSSRGDGLYARHCQYRSFEQMVDKVRTGARAMELSDLHPMYNTHWRKAGGMTDEQLFAQWRELCDEPDLIVDPAPWRHL